MKRLLKSEAKAVMIAVDELRTYLDTVGDEDDRADILRWAEHRLNEMLEDAGYAAWRSDTWRERGV